MELVYNNESYFFYIESDDLKGSTKAEKDVIRLISDDVINFSVTEELGKITTGSLVMRDNLHVYSRIFRNGMKFNISWGYKNWNEQIVKLGIKDGINKLFGKGIRKGIRCIVHQPSGNGDSNGQIIYTVSFYGNEFLNGKEYKVFDSGTRASVINQLFGDLGITDVLIDFNSQNDKVNTETSVRQWESSFALIFRLAYEWRSIFQVGYKPNGDRIGIFIDPVKIDSKNVKSFIEKTTGNISNEKLLYYNSGSDSNVSKYNWKHNIGESGQGDGVIINYINGEPVFQRYVAETQKVITYKINKDRIREKYKNKSASEVISLTNNYWNETDFNQVKWAFDAIEETTAPQGMGYSIDADMFGDPFLTPLLRIKFTDNFPSPLRQDSDVTGVIKFFVYKATHNINKSGYLCNVSIADTYTINGTFLEDLGSTA